MLIGVGLDARLRLTFEELRDLGGEAARLGFESIWTPISNVPDAFHICAGWSESALAEKPGGIRSGIAVLPAPRMWKVETLATQAATVSDISHANFVLGIGTGTYGDKTWEALGLPNKPIGVMKEYLSALRRLFAGESVETNGDVVKLAGFSLGRAYDVPVYLAALGPQMLRLAGTHADGVLLNWATPAQITQSREEVAKSAQSVGRSPSDIPLSMYIRVCIDDDVAAARKALGVQVLGYALSSPGVDPSTAYRGHFTRMGFDAALRAIEEKRDKGAHVADLTEDIPEELIEAVGYYGPAAGAPERFAVLSAGLDETVVRIVTARPGVESVIAGMNALTPEKIRSAS